MSISNESLCIIREHDGAAHILSRSAPIVDECETLPVLKVGFMLQRAQRLINTGYGKIYIALITRIQKFDMWPPSGFDGSLVILNIETSELSDTRLLIQEQSLGLGGKLERACRLVARHGIANVYVGEIQSTAVIEITSETTEKQLLKFFEDKPL